LEYLAISQQRGSTIPLALPFSPPPLPQPLHGLPSVSTPHLFSLFCTDFLLINCTHRAKNVIEKGEKLEARKSLDMWTERILKIKWETNKNGKDVQCITENMKKNGLSEKRLLRMRVSKRRK
jgi:hypothetical protein